MGNEKRKRGRRKLNKSAASRWNQGKERRKIMEKERERERKFKRINKNREWNRKSFKSCKRKIW